MAEQPLFRKDLSQLAPTLETFATLLRDRWSDARIYLFGSRSRGTATTESDYDVVVVTTGFADQRKIERPVDLYGIWWEAGGQTSSLDVHCYTPREMTNQLRGLGYLGQARRRGELREIKPTGALPSVV